MKAHVYIQRGRFSLCSNVQEDQLVLTVVLPDSTRVVASDLFDTDADIEGSVDLLDAEEILNTLEERLKHYWSSNHSQREAKIATLRQHQAQITRALVEDEREKLQRKLKELDARLAALETDEETT